MFYTNILQLLYAEIKARRRLRFVFALYCIILSIIDYLSIAGSQQLLASACIEFISLYIIVIKLMSLNFV